LSSYDTNIKAVACFRYFLFCFLQWCWSLRRSHVITDYSNYRLYWCVVVIVVYGVGWETRLVGNIVTRLIRGHICNVQGFVQGVCPTFVFHRSVVEIRWLCYAATLNIGLATVIYKIIDWNSVLVSVRWFRGTISASSCWRRNIPPNATARFAECRMVVHQWKWSAGLVDRSSSAVVFRQRQYQVSVADFADRLLGLASVT